MRCSLPDPDHDNPDRHRNLPRLGHEAYRGLAIVHWVFSMRDAAPAGSTKLFSCAFSSRACTPFIATASPRPYLPDARSHPSAPDGLRPGRERQRLAVSFWRRQLKPILARAGESAFQAQTYDHVLREPERQRGSFEAHAAYIRRNPYRAGLSVSEWRPRMPLEIVKADSRRAPGSARSRSRLRIPGSHERERNGWRMTRKRERDPRRGSARSRSRLRFSG